MWRVSLNVLFPIRSVKCESVEVIRNQWRAHAAIECNGHRWGGNELDSVFFPICCVDWTNLLFVLFEHPRKRGKSLVQQDDKTLIGHWCRSSSFLSAFFVHRLTVSVYGLSLHTLTRPNIGLEYVRKINNSVNDEGRRTTNSMLSWLQVSTPNERTNKQMRSTCERCARNWNRATSNHL